MSDVRWIRMSGVRCENGYPERRLHTARCQTRMPGRHQRKNFASHIGTATPNDAYTQQGAKPACQDDINAKFSHLLLARYPEHNLHTASCQTRMPGRHQRKIFASPSGTATPNTVYTQQAAKPAWQRRISAKFSQRRHLLCKCQYNSGDTDLSHRHLLCKRQYNYGDTDVSQTLPLQTPI